MADVLYLKDEAGKNMFRRPGGLKFAALQFKNGRFFMVVKLTETVVGAGGEVRAVPGDAMPCSHVAMCTRAARAPGSRHHACCCPNVCQPPGPDQHTTLLHSGV